MAIISISIFLLSAEGITRLYDKYLSAQKIAVSIDDGGSRLAGYAIEKKPDIFRVLVLGDSVAYGQGVKKSETFSKRLEEMLNGDNKNDRFEVINTGFCGIDTTQELGILLNEGPDPIYRPELPGEGYQGLAYKPDMVILQYTISNDAMPPDGNPADPPKRFRDGARRQNYGEYAIPLPDNVDKWLTVNSKFYLFLLNKYHGLLTRIGLRDEVEKVKDMYKPGAIGWLRTRYAINRIGQIAKAYNIPAMMVLWATGEAGTFNNIYASVGETGRGSGFYVLDLSKAVQWPKENFGVSKTDGHPNAKAHSIAAEAIYKFLKEESLVPGK